MNAKKFHTKIKAINSNQMSINYSKVYDSVKRENVVKIMIYYKIHTNIRNTIEKHKQDNTNVKIRVDMNINITSGIRQGYNLSATIFKMITYRIMEEIKQKVEGYYIDDSKIND